MAARSVKDFLSSRRRLAASGLAGLASLLGSHKVEASNYLGGERRMIGTADDIAKPEPYSQPSAMTVNVMDFGARGDAVTDDAPAINAAIHAVRERHQKVGAFDLGCRIVFPAAVYAVDSSIDLTGLQRINTVIDGGGAAILGRCAGQPVIDALGSRWLTVRDLTVLGDPASVPDIGIQIGVVSDNMVADDHQFENVKILGNFLYACLYNRAAETTMFEHLLLWNDQPDSHCLIQDGVNYFGVTSRFVNVILPPHRSLSFNENVFLNCDLRHGAGGTPVWLGDTARHAFIRCYTATDKGPSFVIYCGQNSHILLDIDCHCETGLVGDVFLITGNSDHLTIRGLTYRDHSCFASHSVLTCAEHIKQVEVQDANLSIVLFVNSECRLLSVPELWRISGTYYSASPSSWNGDGVFTGVVKIGSDVRLLRLASDVIKLPDITHLLGISSLDAGTVSWDAKHKRIAIWSGNSWVDALGHTI